MTSANGDGIYSLLGKNLKLTSEEDIEPYLQEIQAVENLKEVHLGGNTLGVGACQALGKLLKTKSTLQVADFADIFTGRLISEIPDALRALCDALVDHESLVEMNLSDNAFGGRSAEPMVNFLTHNHHFSVLKLNNNGLGVTGGQIVANALLAAAEELNKQGKESKLRTIICGRNRLEDGSAPYWAKAYAAHKNIEEVQMFQNGIRMDGIVALAQGLASCPNLKVLDLQDNTATVPGSRGIAASLPSWPQLEVLNLSDCLLKPRGGYLLLDALHKGNNTALKTLRLQYCDLDRKALERLGSALDSGALKNVAKLEINGNWADEDDECIEKIKKALEKNGHEDALDELDEMDPEGEDEDAEEEEDEEEKAGDKGDESKDAAAKSEPVEVAAAAVAAPAASLAVAAQATANAASNVGESLDDKLQKLNIEEKDSTVAVSDEVVEKDADVSMQENENAVAASTAAGQDPAASGTPADEVQGNTAGSDADATAGKEDAIAEEVAPSAQETDATTTSNDKGAQESAALALGGGAAALAGAGVAVAQSSAAATHSDAVEKSQPAAIADSASIPTNEESKAASTAAEVADSAAEVPEEKEAAENAAEVARSAQEVPDVKQAAETADEVDEVAKQVPEQSAIAEALKETAVEPAAVTNPTEATQTLPSTSLPTTSSVTTHHAKQQGSVDLSGELYGDENKARSPRVKTQSLAPDLVGSSNVDDEPSSSSAATAAQPEQQKKRGFRAAIGAIRELLR